MIAMLTTARLIKAAVRFIRFVCMGHSSRMVCFETKGASP